MVRKTRLLCWVVVLGGMMAAPCRAADPPVWLNPLKNFTHSPFSAEVELYTGGISGKSVGAAFDSATRGDYGIRFTMGFIKALNISVNYMYSNQSRSFVAVTPPVTGVPKGTLLMSSKNLNIFTGNGEFNLLRTKRVTYYLSPGVGLARNGARNMMLLTPIGVISSPIGGGRAVTFNLGAGAKVFPAKHIGFRFDIRDYLSGGGTGNLNGQSPACLNTSFACQGGAVLNGAQGYFGPIPVQNNFVVTIGLIFKLI
jgi:hypothetical protein